MTPVAGKEHLMSKPSRHSCLHCKESIEDLYWEPKGGAYYQCPQCEGVSLYSLPPVLPVHFPGLTVHVAISDKAAVVNQLLRDWGFPRSCTVPAVDRTYAENHYCSVKETLQRNYSV